MAVKPACAAASKRSRNSYSVNIMLRLAAKWGISDLLVNLASGLAAGQAGAGDVGIEPRYRGVVAAAPPGARCHQEHLQRRGAHGYRKFRGPCHVLDDTEILDENVHRAARRVVAVEHVRHAVFEQ